MFLRNHKFYYNKTKCPKKNIFRIYIYIVAVFKILKLLTHTKIYTSSDTNLVSSFVITTADVLYPFPCKEAMCVYTYNLKIQNSVERISYCVHFRK